MLRHQHKSNNGVLGAPPGMSAAECGALPITRAVFDDGTPVVMSYWMPSDVERRLIAAGRPVRVTALGSTHPPLALGVEGDGSDVPAPERVSPPSPEESDG